MAIQSDKEEEEDWTTEYSSWVCYTNMVPDLFTIFQCLSLLYRPCSIYQ